tara:strand:+ start:310 stop:486 length:177 start_codon:yes stop_codon:yes gene_type:complete
MYSQIIRIEEGKIKLYVNKTKKEHDNVLHSLKRLDFKPSWKIKKLSDKVYDIWYLYTA